MTRDEIMQAETLKMIVESAANKRWVLTSAEIDAAPGFADLLRQWDWVTAVWLENPNVRFLVVRYCERDTIDVRCTGIHCDNEATALKLHALCRGPDNHAPEPPQSYTTH